MAGARASESDRPLSKKILFSNISLPWGEQTSALLSNPKGIGRGEGRWLQSVNEQQDRIGWKWTGKWLPEESESLKKASARLS
jgi:hypothetical protein